MTDSGNKYRIVPSTDLDAGMYDERTRWKYRRETIHTYNLESQLDSYGLFGWELMFLDPVQSRNTFGELQPPHAYVATFKMPFWMVKDDE